MTFKLRALPLSDWPTLVACAVLLPVVSIALRLFGTRPLQSLLRPAAATHEPAIDVNRLAWLINGAASHHPLAMSCLARSVLLAAWLRCRHVNANLRIGVRFRTGSLEAHSWVERDGRPINDTAHSIRDFHPFDQPVPLHAFRRS